MLTINLTWVNPDDTVTQESTITAVDEETLAVEVGAAISALLRTKGHVVGQLIAVEFV